MSDLSALQTHFEGKAVLAVPVVNAEALKTSGFLEAWGGVIIGHDVVMGDNEGIRETLVAMPADQAQKCIEAEGRTEEVTDSIGLVDSITQVDISKLVQFQSENPDDLEQYLDRRAVLEL